MNVNTEGLQQKLPLVTLEKISGRFEFTRIHLSQWACRIAGVMGSLVFIDDWTGDRSSKMKSEVYGLYSLLTLCQMLQN